MWVKPAVKTENCQKRLAGKPNTGVLRGVPRQTNSTGRPGMWGTLPGPVEDVNNLRIRHAGDRRRHRQGKVKLAAGGELPNALPPLDCTADGHHTSKEAALAIA